MSVVLQKGQKVNLEKKGASLGEVLINLNWRRSQEKKGFFAPKSQPIDLDLGCLYELADGSKGAVQALGNAFGNLSGAPYIALDADDRTGESAQGENLRINGNMVSKIKRVLIYTFIYEGAANWKQADGVVTIRCPGSEEIIVHMDEYNTNQIMCAVALIENTGTDTLSVEKIVRFFDGHEFMDRAFNWGMKWTPGRK